MELKLKRLDYFSDGIFGELYDSAGRKLASTLEHAYDSGNGNGSYVPKLPNGNYICLRGVHKLHDGVPFETFEITGVPGHSDILFHVGNYNKDSDGCVLLGINQETVSKTHYVDNSRIAFGRFIDTVKGLDKFTLTVT